MLWFAVAAGLCSPCLLPRRVGGAGRLPGGLAVRRGASPRSGRAEKDQTLWSPYYKVEYDPDARLIETNNIGHQQMVDVEQTGPAYALPHLLNRAGGGKPFQEVLIIGAGSGNDVAGRPAVRGRARRRGRDRPDHPGHRPARPPEPALRRPARHRPSDRRPRLPANDGQEI